MKKTILIPIIVAAILISVGAFTAWRVLATPLDPPLELDVSDIEIDSTSKTSKNSASAQDSKTCGNSGMMRIFEIGIASPLEMGHVGADAIRLVVVDFDEERAGILALPADLWVATPDDLVDELGSMAPLNEIYLTAYQTESGNPDHVLTQKATQVLAQTIVDEFEFMPDKYITLNGETFIELVDTLGGVTITLATEIGATYENFGTFPIGEQTLTGEQTLDFVRILSPNGVGPDYFGRFERQNMVLHALLDAVLAPENWDEAPELVKEARKMVVTDLSVDQTNDLLCMTEEVGTDAEMFVVSDDMVTIDSQGRMIPDLDAIKDLISEMEGD